MKKIPLRAIAHGDVIQKTWIPEGSKEYSTFKLITQENEKLAEVIKKHINIKPGDLVLDVGGRDGNVAYALQKPEWVHIVDPDPTIRLLKKPGKFWNEKVQNVQFNPKTKYKLIICCHVLGYLGLQEAQEEAIKKLTELLEVGGALVLFYNTNTGYMRDLLDYSRHILPLGHYDYFNEDILQRYRTHRYAIKQLDVSFPLKYGTFADLSRCGWFLFGAMDSDIASAAKKFLPKLKKDLLEPTLVIEERILFLCRQHERIFIPALG